MGKVRHVALREFKHTVLTRAFLIAIIGVPLLIVGIGGLSVLVLATHRAPPLIGTVLVIDDDGGARTDAVAAAFAARAEAGAVLPELELPPELGPAGAAPGGMAGLARGEVRVEVERVAGDPNGDIPDALVARVAAGEALAVATLPDAVIAEPAADADEPRFGLVVGTGVDADHVALIERTIGDAAVDLRAQAGGMSAEELRRLARRPRSETSRLDESGVRRSENEDLREVRRTLIPMAFMMLLWASTFTTGQQLLMSTIEEKSNKVMEVLLSAVSPFQLLAGKILGQGLVGLIILGVYGSLGIFGLVSAARLDLIQPTDLLWLFVYFLLAYFMVASLMAAVGSAVSDIREANSLLTPVMILLMVPMMLWLPISRAPNGVVATACSFVPPAGPFAMIIRVAADEPVPAWQIPATIAWGAVCVLGMMWAAARIFRIGVLMAGKPPTPLELLRWVRAR